MNRKTYTRGSGLRLAVMLMTLSLVLIFGTAQAEYTDSLELDSIKVEAARYSLALDVVNAGNRIVAVGERGHILYTDNGGENWTQADVATRSQLNGVYFVDDKYGWAVGEDAVVLGTTDGGTSWQRLFDARDADLRGPLLDVWFKDRNVGFAVGVYNKIYGTTDGGKTWEDLYDIVDNLDEWHLFNIMQTASGAIYSGSEQGLIFKSDDAGASFAPVQSDHIGSFPGFLARQGEDGQDKLLGFGPGGAVWASHDSGLSWNELNSGTTSILLGGAWLKDGSAVIVGHEGTVLRVDAALENVAATNHESGLPFKAVIQKDENLSLIHI